MNAPLGRIERRKQGEDDCDHVSKWGREIHEL